jgi:transcriptional regulator with XRE-family HTH domain
MAPPYAIGAKKVPSSIDKHVGTRVRMRRIMLAMSQERLADALGVTYQQVQKNERGANRIGASRLQQLSEILQVPVAFFFEGAPTLAPHDSNESGLSMAEIDDFVSHQDGLRLIGAFMRIDNAALRRRIVMLVQEIAGDERSLGTPPGGPQPAITLRQGARVIEDSRRLRVVSTQ